MYGVHFMDGRTEENVIFYTWEEEQKATFHVPHMMHGFETEEEANTWFKEITVQSEENHNKLAAQHREIKKTNKNKVEYRFSLEKGLSDKFQDKLKIMRTDIDTVITDFIKEYIGE